MRSPEYNHECGVTIDEAGSNELRTTLGSGVEGWERLALSGGMRSRDSSGEDEDAATNEAGTVDTLALDNEYHRI